MSDQDTKRRLAAILAADVVGYSRMMAADEAGTLSALRHHWETVFNPAVNDHNGRIVKLIGDGTLVEFASVVDAVRCALAIQNAVDVGSRAGGLAIILRIGTTSAISSSRETISTVTASTSPHGWNRKGPGRGNFLLQPVPAGLPGRTPQTTE